MEQPWPTEFTTEESLTTQGVIASGRRPLRQGKVNTPLVDTWNSPLLGPPEHGVCPSPLNAHILESQAQQKGWAKVLGTRRLDATGSG